MKNINQTEWWPCHLIILIHWTSVRPSWCGRVSVFLMNMSPVMAFEAPEDAGDDIETLWELFVLLKRVIRERERRHSQDVYQIT